MGWLLCKATLLPLLWNGGPRRWTQAFPGNSHPTTPTGIVCHATGQAEGERSPPWSRFGIRKSRPSSLCKTRRWDRWVHLWCYRERWLGPVCVWYVLTNPPCTAGWWMMLQGQLDNWLSSTIVLRSLRNAWVHRLGMKSFSALKSA